MRLGKHYEVIEVLSGGMGEVFICDFIPDNDEPGPQAPTALKTFQQKFFFDNAVRNAFVREASVWLRLTGLPFILPALGIEQIERRPFIRMPAVESRNGVRTLADLIARGDLPPLDALHFAFQIALGMLQAVERVRDLVHGDLKPANVLMMGGKAFVSDFGLATAGALGRADTRLVGTLAYRAPELSAEGSAPTTASDVYAFGASLAEMMTNVLPGETLRAAGLELAGRCMDADPVKRPSGFAEIAQHLSGLLYEHDPPGLIMRMTDAIQYRDLFHQPESRSLHVERVRSLIELGETRQALEELDTIPREQYTPELWLRRAMALSLENRPEDAIEALGPALENETQLEPGSRVLAHSEYALCLKRLGRLDEAERIYRDLLPEVDDEHLSIVVINLATVYLQQRKAEEAVRLLEPFVRKQPDFAQGWANLGRAYIDARRYQDAENALGRALQRDPSAGIVRVWLAELYMEHLGRVPEAWAALDAAFDAGFESREWLVRFLACSLLLERKGTLADLKHALDSNFEKDFADAMIRDATEMAKRIAGGEDDDSAPAASEAIPETPPEPEDDSMAEPISEPLPPSVPNDRSDRRPSTPFINFRYYATGDFTVDFYENPHTPNFLDTFKREWRRALRDPGMQFQGTALRGSPFYFTRCPQCGAYVMTNREIGYKLDCRMCDTRWFTSALDDPSLRELTQHVTELTGIVDAGESLGGIHALLVQTKDAEEQARADEICREAGMTLSPPDRFLTIWTLKQAVDHGACDVRLPWSVWTMPAEGRSWAREATPPDVGRVVRTLQEALPGIRSLSTTIPAESVEAMSGSAIEASARDEQEIREKLRRNDASAEEMRRLASILAQREDNLGEAETIARAALAADDTSVDGWQVLGWIFVRAGKLGAARAPLERALALDPTRVLNWRMLAVSCERTGDLQRAAEARLRATAITGDSQPLFPFE